MIKVGIIGAENPDAGELLRLLINHPEVEVKTLCSPSYAGRPVSSCHHGFIGESVPAFSDKIDPEMHDIIFIAQDSALSQQLIGQCEEWPELRIVDLSPRRLDNWESRGLEYGLSEINRKPLVRGARLAVVPTASAALALIALYPLAMYLLLDSDLEVTVAAPEAVAKKLDKNGISHEIFSMLSKTQSSFNGKVKVNVISCESTRAMRVKTELKCPLAIAEVDKIYDSVYDDHNFTFTSLSGVESREVEGTQKCIVTFSKPGAGLLEVETLGDCHMRGGAGDALHVLNLFFSLDEKVGLRIKPSCFGDENPDDNHQNWFA